MSLIEFMVLGGFLMVVLLIISVIAVAMFIERLLTINKASKFDEKTYIDVLRMIDQSKSAEASKICKFSEAAVCKILEPGLSYADTDLNLAQETNEQQANQFIRSLEKNLNTISTFAAIAPLIGFLGTVTGMIRVFFELADSAGAAGIEVLAAGIWEAMITTVGGLVVGIVCIVFHNYLISKLEAVAFLVEEKVSQVNVHLRRFQK
jgi:biopolymer transport protein ExbB